MEKDNALRLVLENLAGIGKSGERRMSTDQAEAEIKALFKPMGSDEAVKVLRQRINWNNQSISQTGDPDGFMRNENNAYELAISTLSGIPRLEKDNDVINLNHQSNSLLSLWRC